MKKKFIPLIREFSYGIFICDYLMHRTWGVVLVGGIMASTGLLFAATGSVVTEFCSVQKDMTCPDNFATQVAPLESQFLKIKQSYQGKPHALVASQIDRMIQLTQQTESSTLEELKTRYVRRRLTQWRAEVREKLETISLSPKLIRSLKSSYPEEKEFFQAIRRHILPGLVQSGFTKFVKKPYGVFSGLSVDDTGVVSASPILVPDDLDRFIQSWWKKNKTGDVKTTTFYIKPTDIDRFSFVYLFKNKADLDQLGYALVSNRSRKNTDEAYRRHNIKTAFDHIGPVRVLLPGETVSFFKESAFDMEQKTLYKRGKVISSDEEVDDYGGGLCGAATALYQGTVTNQGLAFQMRNHSKRYKSLYTATIDGIKQTTPGIDATVFFPALDIKITNTRTYPIIIVMNYDGTYKGLESVFTLGKSADIGSLSYLSKRPYQTTLAVKGGEKKSVTGWCYSRLINDQKKERCYKEVK